MTRFAGLGVTLDRDIAEEHVRGDDYLPTPFVKVYCFVRRAFRSVRHFHAKSDC